MENENEGTARRRFGRRGFLIAGATSAAAAGAYLAARESTDEPQAQGSGTGLT